MIVCLQLFLTFFEIGLFTFGGGYAMISIVFERSWRTVGLPRLSCLI